jgi:hypothetical protein
MPLAYIRVLRRGEGHPDNELPGMEGPVDPGYGIDLGAGIDNTLPQPPPGIWPPPSHGRPIVPIGPDNTLPVAPGTIWPSPGRPVDPGYGRPGGGPHPGGGPMPGRPGHPSGQPVPGGERPDNTLPGGSGGQIDNTLPSQKFWIVCGIPGLGWRYVCVDPSLEVGYPMPPSETEPTPKG